ncbi:regulating synaptic membrane exocytosis protein 1-like [Carassius auratus]|uniref:Regulating synaptic membrane exocytosis protein 1-like n=1 Tax=Carassius auratus TaxID=7957 RepID=A0A6P6L857_CARAU|nr:regulating synaptic membrane exocytosis protein 1-like [Carassius auratus]
MSASVGPRGGPRPPTAQSSMPDLPDLSHLTEEERKIIMAVMIRQKEEEAKDEAMLKEEKPIQAKTVNLVGNKKPPQQNDIRLFNPWMWKCVIVMEFIMFHVSWNATSLLPTNSPDHGLLEERGKSKPEITY